MDDHREEFLTLWAGMWYGKGLWWHDESEKISSLPEATLTGSSISEYNRSLYLNSLVLHRPLLPVPPPSHAPYHHAPVILHLPFSTLPWPRSILCHVLCVESLTPAKYIPWSGKSVGNHKEGKKKGQGYSRPAPALLECKGSDSGCHSLGPQFFPHSPPSQALAIPGLGWARPPLPV